MSTYSYILASKGLSFESKIIKWYQFGFPYTHVAYVTSFKEPNFNINNPKVIEAWFPKVREGYFAEAHTPGTEFSIFRVKVTKKQKDKIEQFLRSKIGKKYDIIGLLTFLLRIRKVAKNNFWFCSELVFASFKYAGINLLNYTEPQEVTPALLLKSPLLEKVVDGKLPGKPNENTKCSFSFSFMFG